jgi:two-component system CheB/CheR fusion protein
MLGEASRIIARSLFFINIFFILSILFVVGLFARITFKQLMESRRLIIAQNNAKDEFMSIASHELKTPITSMKASLQVLERFTKDSDEARKMHPFIFNANKQVNRLTDLVKDLLDVTKIQSGKLQLKKQPFLLNELVKEVVADNAQALPQQYVIENLPDTYVNADSTRIYQVIENFLSNAAKYSSSAGRVVIWSEADDKNVKVCVQDFGAGIPSNKIPYLFDRFYRIEETRYTVQGLGLGLYICKEIIENHGGKIGAESEVGKGSTFWFSLPMLKVLNIKKDETQIRPDAVEEIVKEINARDQGFRMV